MIIKGAIKPGMVKIARSPKMKKRPEIRNAQITEFNIWAAAYCPNPEVVKKLESLTGASTSPFSDKNPEKVTKIT